MTWSPIALTVPQYEDANGNPYSGAVLKAYAAGTSTPISMATDSTGNTTVASIALNASGYPAVSGNVVIPHVAQSYKLALYPTQAAADADSGAIWSLNVYGLISSDGSENWCGTATGTANALILTPTTAITAYAAGQRFVFKSSASTNTGAITFAVSGLTTKAGQTNGVACIGGEIQADQWYQITYQASGAFEITALGSPIFQPASGIATTVQNKLRSVVEKNLVPNSDLSICCSLPLVRVGTPIAITAWSDIGVNLGNVAISSGDSVAGHANGITAGKLLLVEGAGTPHTAHVGLSATVTLTKRITAAAGSFTGVEVGDVPHITGGTNTSPKAKYRITATDADTYIEVFGFSATPLVNEGPLTFDITWYEGSKDVNTTVNGMPAAGDGTITSAIGYPLQATEVNAGSFAANLAGKVLASAGSGTARGWEVTPGDEGFGTGDAADGWKKTPSLRYFRTYDKDWDGTTSVIKTGGSMYGCKVKKGSAGTEYLYSELAASSPVTHVVTESEKLQQFKGRTIAFGMYWWPPGASKARLYCFDGVSWTYSDYFASGSLGWKELTKTISTAATRVEIGVEITGSVDDLHYGTQPMAIFGQNIGEGNYVPTEGFHVFSTHPNFPYYINAAVTENRAIRLEQESLGTLPRGLKALYLGVEGNNRNLPSANTALLITESATQRIPSITIDCQALESQMVFSTGGTTIADALTRYFEGGFVSATETETQVRCAYGMRVVGMYVQTSGDQAPGISTYTLRKNTADTAMTCATAGASTQASDVASSHWITYAAGDVLSIKCVTSGGVGTPRMHRVTLAILVDPIGKVVNSGVAVIGKLAEGYPATWRTDEIYLITPDGGWAGLNLDMFACQL